MTTEPTPRRNFSSWRSYSEIAQALGLRHCGDGSDSAHRNGKIEYGDPPCLHWMERRITKRGLRRFLKLAALAIGFKAKTVVLLYHQNVEADRLGRQLGVRFPRHLADPDRARVRLWMAKQRYQLDPALKRRIQRWARP